MQQRLPVVKGVQYLIEAMAIIHQEMPGVKLIIVGEGIEREKLEGLTKQLDLKECIQFVGRVPQEKIPLFMQQADIFVLPSLAEGFPNVLLEAMACGLPIVATSSRWVDPYSSSEECCSRAQVSIRLKFRHSGFGFVSSLEFGTSDLAAVTAAL